MSKIPQPQAEAKVPIEEPKRRGRKRKNKRYFTDITEMAINAYNSLSDEDVVLKNKIYNRFLHYPFYKLSEIVYNTGRYPYIDLPPEDIKHELITLIISKLYMYKPDKGKAFSYFNRVIKNELIASNQLAYKKTKISVDLLEADNTRNILIEESTADMLSDQAEFMNLFVEYVDANLGNFFNNRRDIAIADSILELFRNRHIIENYNKKALYLLVRERSRCEQPYVTKVVNDIKEIYEKMFPIYQKTGRLEPIHNNTNNNFFNSY